ncbi:hypothetical protein WB334_26180, partial [Escherichia coli]
AACEDAVDRRHLEHRRISELGLAQFRAQRRDQRSGDRPDQGFAGEMRTLFEDDLTQATQIVRSEWKKRPVKQKLRERFWVIWERML